MPIDEEATRLPEPALDRSLMQAIERLQRSDWPVRWQRLAGDHRLQDASIAEFIEVSGDELLAIIVRRSAVAGVSSARESFELVSDILRLERDSITTPSSDFRATLRRILSVVLQAQHRWLGPRLLQALENISLESRQSLVPIADGALRLRLQLHDVTMGTGRIAEKRIADFDQTWRALDGLISLPQIDAAAEAVAWQAKFILRDTQIKDRAEDFLELLRFARQFGVNRAVHAHKMVIATRRAEADAARRPAGSEPCASDFCGGISEMVLMESEATGSTWLLDAAIRVGEAALRFPAPSNKARSRYLANLGSALGRAVEYGLREKGDLEYAIQYQLTAVGLLEPGDEDLAIIYTSLANHTSDAALWGVVGTHRLEDALAYQQQALSHTPEGHPNRQGNLSNLGNRVKDLLSHGSPSRELMEEGLQASREAVQTTLPGDPALVRYNLNLGLLLSISVAHGLLPKTGLLEAVDLMQAVVDDLPAGHAKRGFAELCLGNTTAEAVGAHLLPASELQSAVHLIRVALERMSPDDPRRLRDLNDLASRLSESVLVGVSGLDALEEAIDLQRLSLTRPGSLSSIDFMNMGNRLSEGIMLRILPISEFEQAISFLRRALEMEADDVVARAVASMNLAGKLDNAVLLGALEPSHLLEAVDLYDSAIENLPTYHPFYEMCLIGSTVAIINACNHELLPPSARLVAFERATVVSASSDTTGEARARVSAVLAHATLGAIQAGLLPIDRLLGALESAREAVHLADSNLTKDLQLQVLLADLLLYCLASDLLPVAEVVTDLRGVVEDLWDVTRLEAALPDRRRLLASHVSGLTPQLPLAILEAEGPSAAICAIEGLRAYLAGGMRAPVLEASLRTEWAEVYAGVAQRYEDGQQRSREGLERATSLIRATQGLLEIVHKIRASDPQAASFGGVPTISSLSHELSSSNVAIYLMAAEQGGSALYLFSDGSTGVVQLPEFSSDSLEENLVALATSRSSIPFVCEWIGRTITVPVLDGLQQLKHAPTQWLVIATGGSARLPIHAGLHGGVPLDDIVEVTYIPTLVSLSGSGERFAGGTNVAAIAAAGDLDYLVGDEVVCANLLPQGATILSGDSISVEDVLDAAAQSRNFIVSAHASATGASGAVIDFNGQRLSGSELDLLPLRNRGHALMMTCESVQPGTDLPEESIGLPFSLLNLGFVTVVGTLWPVKDEVAFLALARLLEVPMLGSHRTREVRRWLRTSTGIELSEWLSELSTEIAVPAEIRSRLLLKWGKSGTRVPYARPQDWAVFAEYGHRATSNE